MSDTKNSDKYHTYGCYECEEGRVTQYPDRSACDNCSFEVQYPYPSSGRSSNASNSEVTE